MLKLAVFVSNVYPFILSNIFWHHLNDCLTSIIDKSIDKCMKPRYLCIVVFS